MGCEGNKGNWIALNVFGGLKVVTGLVLMIVGIILMAHSPRECAEITKCYEDKGIPKCSWSDRRLSEADFTQPWDSYPETILPRVKQLAIDVLGLDRKALQAGPLALVDDAAEKGHQLASTRRLADDCYTSYKECDEDMKKMSDGAGSWGTALMIIGLIGGLSGFLSILAAKQKLKRWLAISMTIDILMMILCVCMWFLCGILAGVMKAICDHIHEKAEENAKECWEDFIGDICSWADLFGTATIMFLMMFFVELGTTIVDCSTCCCCVPEDAHWSPKAQAAGGSPVVAGAVIGQPVNVQPKEA